jgi:hypothetical protein
LTDAQLHAIAAGGLRDVMPKALPLPCKFSSVYESREHFQAACNGLADRGVAEKIASSPRQGRALRSLFERQVQHMPPSVCMSEKNTSVLWIFA